LRRGSEHENVLYDGSNKRKRSNRGKVTLKNMGHRVIAGIAVVAALGCAGGAFLWLHGRNNPPTERAARTAPTFVPSANAAEGKSSPGAGEKSSASARENAAGGSASAGAADANKGSAIPDAGLPLRAGEVLEYTADVSKVSNVANLRLQVAERGKFLGKNSWHLRAFAHTENPLRMVFALDDEFDSYSDAGNMASLQYEMHLDERGQKVESIQRMTVTGREPAPTDATETRVLPGTRDPLGMMQYLRGVDWEKTSEVRSPVYDGRKLYDVRAKVAGTNEAVSVPAGSFKATKIELRVFDGGVEMKDAKFALYLANSAARTPVLLEAVLPFATARVELKSSK
jgi:Protein of unknown function (DUF3108)